MSRPTDFRFVFSNAIGFGMNDNDCRIMFALAEDMSKPDESIDQAGVMLTHKTAKLLWYILDSAIKHYEETTQTEIPLEREKVDSFRAAISGAD